MAKPAEAAKYVENPAIETTAHIMPAREREKNIAISMITDKAAMMACLKAWSDDNIAEIRTRADPPERREREFADRPLIATRNPNEMGTIISANPRNGSCYGRCPLQPANGTLDPARKYVAARELFVKSI